MTIFEYILIALAFGTETMLFMRRHTEKVPVRLTQGAALASIVALVYAVMFLLGIRIGNILRFADPDMGASFDTANSLVFVGLAVVVVLKMLISLRRRKNREAVIYNIERYTTMVALAFAMGINVLIFGLGVGFLPATDGDLWRVAIPMFVAVLLLAYWGIMLGRQKVEIREKRWIFISVILLLAVVLYRVVTL
ncbi:MAG: manganese efflux pump [Bacteroidales bacterium]|nr:manganese efflux pump [Bacteroidales bacterium]